METVEHSTKGVLTTAVWQENSSYVTTAHNHEINSRHFSYIDKHGDLRGPFTARCMQQWYDKGFFANGLQVFVHRGQVADRFSLDNLCEQNGNLTPFLFFESPHCLHCGYTERPPGLNVEKKNRSSSLNKAVQCSSDCDLEGEVSISTEEADRAKAWPLLSRSKDKPPKTKKKIWIMGNFYFLRTELLHCDLAKIDNDPENNDLRGAVCKLCCIRLSAASDVLKHLTLESHQSKVLQQCQISGTEFNEYYKRLMKVRLESVRWMEEVMKISDAPKPDPKPDPDHTEEESTSPPAAPMLMQATSTKSRELTDEEFEAAMKELRKLSFSVKPKKFIEMYKDKMMSTRCTSCNVKTQGPMEVLSHYVSRLHCGKMREKGCRVTKSDIRLWKSQIEAGS